MSSLSYNNSMSKHESFEKPYDRKAKILLIGNGGVGKSSILLQFSERKFSHSYYNTIGVDYKIRYMKLQGRTVKLQIWDTAGQDRFKTITSSYYRGADAILIVYDITDRPSFQNVKNWLDQIQKYTSERVVRLIVGNKKDLEEKRQVKTAEGQQMAQELGIPFQETSARSLQDIEALFAGLVDKLGVLKFDEEKETASKTQFEVSQPAQTILTPQSSAVTLKLEKKKSRATTKCCATS